MKEKSMRGSNSLTSFFCELIEFWFVGIMLLGHMVNLQYLKVTPLDDIKLCV